MQPGLHQLQWILRRNADGSGKLRQMRKELRWYAELQRRAMRRDLQVDELQRSLREHEQRSFPLRELLEAVPLPGAWQRNLLEELLRDPVQRRLHELQQLMPRNGQ